MQNMVHQPVGEIVQDAHDLFVLILGFVFMLFNKFIKFGDKFLMLDLLGEDFLVMNGFHIIFFICKVLYV